MQVYFVFSLYARVSVYIFSTLKNNYKIIKINHRVTAVAASTGCAVSVYNILCYTLWEIIRDVRA